MLLYLEMLLLNHIWQVKCKNSSRNITAAECIFANSIKYFGN